MQTLGWKAEPTGYQVQQTKSRRFEYRRPVSSRWTQQSAADQPLQGGHREGTGRSQQLRGPGLGIAQQSKRGATAWAQGRVGRATDCHASLERNSWPQIQSFVPHYAPKLGSKLPAEENLSGTTAAPTSWLSSVSLPHEMRKAVLCWSSASRNKQGAESLLQRARGPSLL